MSYVRFFKNKSGATKVYFGISFDNNEIKQVPDGKILGFAKDEIVLQDLANGDAIMSNDGTTEYDGTVSDQIDFLKGLLPTKVYSEIEDNRYTPKFAHQIASFSGNTCTLTFTVPGTLGAENRFLFDGYLMTDAFYFGDKVSDISVVINNATLAAAMGVPTGYVAETFHDNEITTGEPGWLLWAGQEGIGEVDVENAGGMKNIIGGADIVITVTKDISSSATKAGCNLFWSAKN